MKYIFNFVWTIVWVAGIVIANGFWSTFFAIMTGGLWSTYLVVEKLMKFYGVL